MRCITCHALLACATRYVHMDMHMHVRRASHTSAEQVSWRGTRVGTTSRDAVEAWHCAACRPMHAPHVAEGPLRRSAVWHRAASCETLWEVGHAAHADATCGGLPCPHQAKLYVYVHVYVCTICDRAVRGSLGARAGSAPAAAPRATILTAWRPPQRNPEAHAAWALHVGPGERLFGICCTAECTDQQSFVCAYKKQAHHGAGVR